MSRRPRLWWTSVKGGRRARRRPFKWSRDEGPDQTPYVRVKYFKIGKLEDD